MERGGGRGVHGLTFYLWESGLRRPVGRAIDKSARVACQCGSASVGGDGGCQVLP